jgi:hypothetical protein
MPELTPEALAARLAVVEQKLSSLTAIVPPTRDWRSVIGISEETDFSRLMQAEMQTLREEHRQAAIKEDAAELVH